MSPVDGVDGAPSTAGRRERKKAGTRRRIADAALELFLARGFDTVTVAEIADAADVAVSTLFAHFPSKEALVLDEDGAVERALVDAVRDRPAGTSVVDALHSHLRTPRPSDPGGLDRFVQLTRSTPALRDYWQRILRRHEASLAAAIAQESGLPPGDVTAAALARYVLEAHFLAEDRADPIAALDAVFERLRRGWGELGGRP